MDIIYTKQIYTQEHQLKISDIEYYQSETGNKRQPQHSQKPNFLHTYPTIRGVAGKFPMS